MGHSDKISVLFLLSSLAKSGPGTQIYNTIIRLDRAKFESLVMVLSGAIAADFSSAFEALGVESLCLDLPERRGILEARKRVREFVRSRRVHIVQTMGFRADIVAALSGLGIPRVSTRRSCLFSPSIFRLASVMDLCDIAALSMCTLVVFVSEYMMETAPAFLRRKGIVIRNGVDTRVFGYPSEAERRICRDKLGLPDKLPVFLCVGHLTPDKNPLFILKGFQDTGMAKKARLIFLGEGFQRSQCEAFARGIENVRFDGQVKNVSEYYKAADYFVSASLTEGCPNAVIEALSCGLPVVLSNIPAHREVLGFDHDAGVLFELGDSGDFANKLDMLMRKDYAECSKAAARLGQEVFSADVVCAAYERLYAHLHGAAVGTKNP